MEWIYFSPHLDDIALSLGGLLWEQSQAGMKVSIWTVCAGDPPSGELSPFAQSLHDRWKTGKRAINQRKMEDIKSCRVLGSHYYHFHIPDCIYRRSPRTGEHLYDSEEDLWIQVHPDEKPLIDHLSQKIQKMLGVHANIVCPLTLGNHVDHLLTRCAVESAVSTVHQPHNWILYYYADYPYVLNYEIPLKIAGLNSILHTVSDNGLCAWQEAITHHESQISTFWRNTDEMRIAIQSYYNQMGGIWLGNK